VVDAMQLEDNVAAAHGVLEFGVAAREVVTTNGLAEVKSV
jgi:hypothetical protein